MNCKTCKSHCAWVGKEESEHGKCLVGYTPITNADRIRAMTDEELAQFIWDAMDMICPDNCYEYPERLCAVCILDWLKQEVIDD